MEGAHEGCGYGVPLQVGVGLSDIGKFDLSVCTMISKDILERAQENPELLVRYMASKRFTNFAR